MRKSTVLVIGLLFMAKMCFAEGEMATFLHSEGKVTVLDTVKNVPLKCEPGTVLGKDQKIITGDQGYVELSFDDKNMNIVKVNENTEVKIILDKEEKLELLDGKLLAVLDNLKNGEKFRIRTPAASCGARGTSWETVVKNDLTEVLVASGKVFIQGINPDGTLMKKKYWVKKGYRREIKNLDKPGKQAKIEKNDFKRLIRDIDRPVLGINVRPVLKDKLSVKRTLEPASDNIRTDIDKSILIDRKEALSDTMEKRGDMQETIIDRSERKEKLMKRIDSRERMDRIINRQNTIERRIDKRDNIEEQQRQDLLDRREVDLLKKRLDSVTSDGSN